MTTTSTGTSTGTEETTTSARRYHRAPHLALLWEGREMRCAQATTGHVHRISAEMIPLLCLAGEAATVDDLAEGADVDRGLVQAAISAGLLVAAEDETAASIPGWHTFELAVQRLLGKGRRRPLPGDRPEPVAFTAPTKTAIALETPRTASQSEVPFSAVLAARRSRRRFAPEAMPLAQLARLLGDVVSVQYEHPATRTWRRSFPSGGARHPLELYLAAFNVDSLDPACYYFCPLTGTLTRVTDSEQLTEQLRDLVVRELEFGDIDPPTPPAAKLLITALFERTLSCYRDFGLTLVHKETGCLQQALALQMTAQGLAGYPIGGGPESAIARGLGLDPVRHSYVGGVAVGMPATPYDPRTEVTTGRELL